MELEAEISKIESLEYAQLETYLNFDPKTLLLLDGPEESEQQGGPLTESDEPPQTTVSTRSTSNTRRSLPSINKKIALFTRANTRLKVLNSSSSSSSNSKIDQEPSPQPPSSSESMSLEEEKTSEHQQKVAIEKSASSLNNTSPPPLPTVSSKSQHLAPNEYIIQGKKVKMTPSECQRFTRNGKWRCNEFFRFKTVDQQHECEFCTTKCKTVIEGVYVCASCRHFSYKALVKHHMFVCKSQSLTAPQSNPPPPPTTTSNDGESAVVLCEFRLLANTSEASAHHSNTSTYCRYCHFYSIVNRLPSLRRLQKYLVLFVQNRVLFVNSVSKKTMMWKSRLQLGSLDAATTSPEAKPITATSSNKKPSAQNPTKLPKPNGVTASKINADSSTAIVSSSKKMSTREAKTTADNQYYYSFKSGGGNELKRNEQQQLLSSNNKENDFLVNENSSEELTSSAALASGETHQQRVGPRVKQVSRYHPAHLSHVYSSCSSVLSLEDSSNSNKNGGQKNHPFKCTFYTNLRRINQDLGPICISWQTFLADVKSDFSLSAMPQTFKEKIFHKYEQTRLSLMDQAASSTSAGLANDETTHAAAAASIYDFNEASELNKSLKKSLDNKLNSNKKKSSAGGGGSNKNTRKPTLSEMVDEEEEFDWDEYFDVNHRISTSQNIRYLQSLQSSSSTVGATQLLGSAGNISRNITNVNSNTNLLVADNNNESSSPSSAASFLASNKKKRFDDRLNSYKDAAAASLAATSVITASASGSNLLVDESNIAAAAAVVAYNMITASNSKKSSQNQPNTIIWDNNIVNNFNDLNKCGFAVVSYRPICLKSICFLCGSNSEHDNNQLLYCNICCEPYHQFCLEEHERPKSVSSSSLLNWTCPTCKFCEICGLSQDTSCDATAAGAEPQLQSCAKCNDAYHVECLKRAPYPKRACKKKKVWICAKCFECGVCASRSIQFDKKYYNKLVNYDFGSCLRCYEKYQLEKPLRCCFLFATHNLGQSRLDDRIVQCDTCFSWTHFACNDLTDEEIEFVKSAKLHSGLSFKFECKSCDESNQTEGVAGNGGSGSIRKKLNEFKIKCLGELFTEIINMYNLTGMESMLADFLSQQQTSDSFSLSGVYTELFNRLTTTDSQPQTDETTTNPTEADNSIKIRDSLTELINTKYQHLKQCLTSVLLPLPSTVAEPMIVDEEVKQESVDKVSGEAEPMDATPATNTITMTTDEDAKQLVHQSTTENVAESAQQASASTTASIDPASLQPQQSTTTVDNLVTPVDASRDLAQKKKQFFMNELVRCPYEDHTYAISSSSIAIALQSSNIFNQNNTSDHLYSFLGQIKDMQVNPKLQTILSKMIEENKATAFTNNEQIVQGGEVCCMKQFDNLIGAEGGDSRDCFTCRLLGDDPICGRLLPFDSYWIHTNCLLWTDEVGVTQGGTMVDPIEAVLNRTKTKCSVCEKERATIRCTFDKTCNKFYHFKCAYNARCAISHKLQQSSDSNYLASSSNHKKMFTLQCASHAVAAVVTTQEPPPPCVEVKEPMESQNVQNGDIPTTEESAIIAESERVEQPPVIPSKTESPLSGITNLNIQRRLIIDVPDELYSKKKYARLRFSLDSEADQTKGGGDGDENDELAPYILVGSVQIKNLGDLETISDYRSHLCPINFKSTRLYWSTKEVGKKCVYTCRIRHIEAYKRDFKNRSQLITSLIDKMMISTTTNDVTSGDCSMDTHEEAARPVVDCPLDPLSQLDGQDDTNNTTSTNLQFQPKTILKFPTSTTFVQRPGAVMTTTTTTTAISRPTTIVNTMNHLDAAKPKVVKLDSLKCFSNIKTPSGGLNLPSVSSTATSSNTSAAGANMMMNNSNRFMILNQNVKQQPLHVQQMQHYQQQQQQPPGTVFYPTSGNNNNKSSKLSINTSQSSKNNNKNNNTVISNLISLQSSTTASSSFASSAMSASSSNENLISPKSDKSDSSLNLNNSASIQNPLKASFEDISSLGLLTAVQGAAGLAFEHRFDPNSIRTAPQQQHHTEFYFQPPNQPVSMLHITPYNHLGSISHHPQPPQAQTNGAVKKKNSMPKQSKKRMRSEESTPAVVVSAASSTNNSLNMSQNDSSLFQQPPPPVTTTNNNNNNNNNSSSRSSNKCTVAALLSACSAGQVPSNLTLKRGDKIAQKLMQINPSQQQQQQETSIELGSINNASFSPSSVQQHQQLTLTPVPISLNQSQDNTSTLLMSLSQQGLNSSQVSATSLLDNSIGVSSPPPPPPPPPSTSTTASTTTKSSKSKNSSGLKSTSPNKAPKPPAAKKPPQAKLRDYFSEKDQNSTNTTTTAANNSLSDEQTQQIKQELREMMAAARGMTSGDEQQPAPGMLLPFRKSLAGRKKKNPLAETTTTTASSVDIENNKKVKKLKKLEEKLESKKKSKESKISGQMAKKNLYKDTTTGANTTSPTCNFSSNGFLFENEYNDLDLDQFSLDATNATSSSQHTSQLVFEIVAEDGFRVVSYDINKAWRVITDKVSRLRQAYKQKQQQLKSLSFRSLSGARMFGLNAKATVFMLEQMDSIEFCPLYTSKFISRESLNDKWIINLNNCARTGTASGIAPRKCFDQFYWLASEHRSLSFLNNIGQRFNQQFLQANKALTSVDICNSLKFRHLKEFSKSALLVKKSLIHGRGLFTLVDLAQGQMIIEYAGEIIRNELCNRREKYYESKGIGCYMFRIDEYEVIDATTKGNQARFINHSCEPSCHSRVLLVQGVKHIVIFAQRNIARGEELTYDYKFPKEDDKIKCLCKSAKCRKYLN